MKALILVDIQNDFIPGGALEVGEGDKVVPIANDLMPKFELVVATQDYHPANHKSFAANHEGKNVYEVIDLNGLEQTLWPVHCVQASKGAELHPDLDISYIEKVFPKGTDPEIDSYSGFFDNGRRQATGLGDFLKEKGVKTVYVMGLAQDYCVKFTALDAADLGFETYLVLDGTRPVNIHPEDGDKAVEEMKKAGVKVISSVNVLSAQTTGSAS